MRCPIGFTRRWIDDIRSFSGRQKILRGAIRLTERRLRESVSTIKDTRKTWYYIVRMQYVTLRLSNIACKQTMTATVVVVLAGVCGSGK